MEDVMGKLMPLWVTLGVFIALVILIAFAGQFLANTAAIWLFVVLLFCLYWARWHYARRRLLVETDWRLLEIIVPKEVTKTPKAMETIITTLNQTYQGQWWLRITAGKYMTWFTFEIASFEGDIHFYMFLDSFQLKHVKAQFYANYPEILIREVDDYTNRTPTPWKGDFDMYGFEFKFAKPDPYPIKTYVDWGLDDPGAKEESKTDPMAATLEMLSSLSKGEYGYVQILFQPTKKRKRHGFLWLQKKGWEEEAQETIDALKKKASRGVDPDTGELTGFAPTPGEKSTIEAIERNISKIGFDVGIRCLYIAKKDVFNKPSQHGMTRLFDSYFTLDLNGFKLGEYTGYDYPWQDPSGRLSLYKKKKMFGYYQLRSYFYPPYRRLFGYHSAQSPFMVLNEEELATIFHIPGGVVTAAGVSRIESKKTEAPVNIPT